MKSTTASAGRQAIPFIWPFVILSIAWTVVAALILVWERNDRQEFLTSNALSIARATFEKDIAFRRWAAKHGGVYVPQSSETPPNPHLNVPEREIVTPSGKKLTLMNPAYMIRQVYEINQAVPGTLQGHITSLNPIRPQNAPDPWERRALEAFEKGVHEVTEFENIDGKLFFRFMHPLKTEKPCLNCHAAQGYKEGEIRGGISVSLPVADLAESIERSSNNHSLIITVIWFAGIIGLWFSLSRVRGSTLALQDSEERYRQQFQQSNAVMMIIDPETGCIVDVNPAACAFYGYSSDEMRSLKIADINSKPEAELQKCIAGVIDGSIRQFTARHYHSDGSCFDVEVFSNPVTFGSKILLHSIIFDITYRLLAEQELQNKMDFAENLVLNSTTPTFVINFDHQVLIWNKALEELTGVKAQEVIGTNEHWHAFYAAPRPCLADVVLDGSFSGAVSLYPHISRSRLITDGLRAEGDYSFDNHRCRLVFSAAPIRDRDGNIIAAIQTLEDVTERINLETQLLQAQKMESVGELAGGIAHDFNNILTVINGYTDLLKMTAPDDEDCMNIAGEISASVDRAANMTRTLLAFSGKHEMLLQYDDLNHIVDNIRKSLIRLIREDITLTLTAETDVRLPVYVDRVQVEQVLINLVVNARDALGSAAGVIEVITSLAVVKEKQLVGNTLLPPGEFACLCVKDNGNGIDSKTMERIFEPFFTTKDRGKGTGLGLAIVHSIVSKLNGHVAVTTNVGIGTEFRIYLPLYTGETPLSRANVTQVINHHGTETILVVEDDSAIMRLHREVLGRYGYEVLMAADGVEALELFAEHHEQIKLVMVDVIMPRMNGREVVENIRREYPDLPIIMTSGYTDDIIDRTAIDDLNVMFLQKPVKPLDLLATIRASL